MIKYSGLSTLANAWTCYTQPTPVPHLGDNAPPALNSMSFLSAVARRRMTARTSVNRFFCLAWSPTPFLLMSIRVVALLVIILVSVTIGLTKLLMKMDMHPGFLRTGWWNELLDFACYFGQASCAGFLHRWDSWHPYFWRFNITWFAFLLKKKKCGEHIHMNIVMLKHVKHSNIAQSQT